MFFENAPLNFSFLCRWVGRTRTRATESTTSTSTTATPANKFIMTRRAAVSKKPERDIDFFSTCAIFFSLSKLDRRRKRERRICCCCSHFVAIIADSLHQPWNHEGGARQTSQCTIQYRNDRYENPCGFVYILRIIAIHAVEIELSCTVIWTWF